jgi:hypothetical protein
MRVINVPCFQSDINRCKLRHFLPAYKHGTDPLLSTQTHTFSTNEALNLHLGGTDRDLYFLSGNRSTFQFYYHQAGLAKPAGIAVSCAAAASHLSQSYCRERTQIFWTLLYQKKNQKNIMNLNERYKELRGKTEQSMGRLVVVQQAMNDRAAAGVDGGVVMTGGPVPVDEGENQQWPPPPPGLSPQVHSQAHGQARQAEAVRNQIPIVHRLAAPAAAATATAALRPGTPFSTPSAAAAASMMATPARVANPFTFTAPSYRQPIPQVTQVQQVQQQQQQYPGPSYSPGPRGRTDQARVLVTSRTLLMGRHSSCRHTAACGTNRSNSSREMARPDS